MHKNVTFEKVVGGGKALGYVAGRPCFAAGPLPGEVADVVVTREKSGFIEANVVRIVKPAVQRNLPAEDHYLECSPWQNVEYSYQLELKRRILTETFARPDLTIAVADMVGADERLGYRNKLEFSVKNENGELALAFHARGSFEQLVALPSGCRLGSAAMNEAALDLLRQAQALKLGGYIETITIRRSVSSGQLLGVIALHQVPKRRWNELERGKLAGLVVSRLRGRERHEVIWHAGETGLVERLGDLELGYPFDSFFQTNPAVFERALEQIVEAVPAGSRVVDLYGGVGSIGLAAAHKAREVMSVEISAPSTEWALGNADRNAILNYTAAATAAERTGVVVLRGADCVIVDPPRAGLHQNVIGDLLEALPARIIYLSCNPATQARDIKLLAGVYQPGAVTGFDFYPGTLHLESLVVMDRRSSAALYYRFSAS